jgi:hypothetical protein
MAYPHLLHIILNLRLASRRQRWSRGKADVFGDAGQHGDLLVVGGLLVDLLGATSREGDVVRRGGVVGLEAVVLDGVEVAADGGGVGVAHVAQPLEVRAVDLGTFGQRLVQQRLEPVLEQGVLVLDLAVAVPLEAFELAEQFGMAWDGVGELFEFVVKFGDPLVVDPGFVRKIKKIKMAFFLPLTTTYLSRSMENSFSSTASASRAAILRATAGSGSQLK